MTLYCNIAKYITNLLLIQSDTQLFDTTRKKIAKLILYQKRPIAIDYEYTARIPAERATGAVYGSQEEEPRNHRRNAPLTRLLRNCYYRCDRSKTPVLQAPMCRLQVAVSDCSFSTERRYSHAIHHGPRFKESKTDFNLSL